MRQDEIQRNKDPEMEKSSNSKEINKPDVRWSEGEIAEPAAAAADETEEEV